MNEPDPLLTTLTSIAASLGRIADALEEANKRKKESFPPHPPSKKEREFKNTRAREEDSPDSAALYDAARRKWNTLASGLGLPMVRSMTAKRKAAVRKRSDDILANWDAIEREIRQSSFLQGKRRGSTWRMTFDFLWGRPDAWSKIVEGTYRDNPNAPRQNAEASPRYKEI